ncbi:hypothetical protein BCR36DRAFT_320168 [Piromyces finnis]|uniref:CBM21 domain-containing protein n=1 Tax=Piromyces finnis TaxID=1754191 RepID=A0A1Y1VHV3_9FUNG|nr:hypothetical protein BCR36DRAFT_320168 [Piromyces finnis]|eukprot:ORX56622.1 hypothetical protein BCR36DRAFT_320168 [Piromyces finnis]
MIKNLSFSQNQEICSKNWDSNNVSEYLKESSFDLNSEDRIKIKNNTSHEIEKKCLQESIKKKEILNKNFNSNNRLKKKKSETSSIIIPSSAPTSSPIDIIAKNKKSKNLSKSNIIMKNISNNYGMKNFDNKNFSCSVDDIYKIEPKSEFKAKTQLLKSLVETIEDDTEDTCYDIEYSERSFIDNLSICKSTSNGIVSESLNAPSVSEITVTPAVVSIINTKSEINDLKQDLERYSKNTINENKNNKSKFFSKKFFSRFKSFGWFDSQKRNNKKSSLSQSSTINYSVTISNLEEISTNSSSNSIKDQTDNEKSEITLVSSRNCNFEFTALNSDSLSSKDSDISKTFIINNSSKLSNEKLNEKENNEKCVLNNNILSNDSKISNEFNDNDEDKNKETIISETKFKSNKNNLFLQNNSDDSSLFSSSSLNDNAVSLSDIPITVSNDDNDYNLKENVDALDKIENFDEAQILSTSSPKFEVESENKLKNNIGDDITDDLNVISNIPMNMDEIEYIEEKIEENLENEISSTSSNMTSPSNIGILEYETESEVDAIQKMSNYDSDIEVEIIAISSPSEDNENSFNDDSINPPSNSKGNNNFINESKTDNIEINHLDFESIKVDAETNNTLSNDTQNYLYRMNNSMITQIDGKENESENFLYNLTNNKLDENLQKNNIIDDTNDLIKNDKDLYLNSTGLLSSSLSNDKVILSNKQTLYNDNGLNDNNNNNNNNKINTELPISNIIPLSINNTNLSTTTTNINLSHDNTLNTNIDIPETSTFTLSSKTSNITPSPTLNKILPINNNDNNYLLSESPSSISIPIDDDNKNNSLLNNENTESTTIQSEFIDSKKNEKSLLIPKEKDTDINNTDNPNYINLKQNLYDDVDIKNYQCSSEQSTDIVIDSLNESMNDEFKTTTTLEKEETLISKENPIGVAESSSKNDTNSEISKESTISNENIDEDDNNNDTKNEIKKEEVEKCKDMNKTGIIGNMEQYDKNSNNNIDMISDESIKKKNHLKSVLKSHNRHSFPQCGTPFEMSLLTHIPLNQIGDKENKISIPGVETIVVRQRRKSVNFDRNAFEKVCYFTSTEKPKDIHSRDVQIKEDEQSSNSIQTLLNTEVQKLLSDEVTGKGEYSNFSVGNKDTSEINENTTDKTAKAIKTTTEPETIVNLDISSDCKEKISKESLTSLNSLTSISDSISISKDSQSSESNTLSITIKAEVEQQIKNNCLLKDSSLKLNDPSASWSPIPRNVIHLPKMKNKSKDWEPHIAVESFELAPRFEGQTQDMWDVLEVKLKVQNLDYHKKVFIRYTTNDWASYEEEEAKYSCCIREGVQGIHSDPNSGSYDQHKKVGLDRFIARIDASNAFVLPDCGRHTCMQRPTKMLLVAKYEVLGTTYWDNNHFTDYKLELVRIPAGYDVPRHHGHSKAGDASIIACAACAEEKRETELSNVKKLQKEDEKEKKERRKVRHFGGGKALLSNNFSVMNTSNNDKDFSLDPNNVYAKEVMKNNKLNKNISSKSNDKKYSSVNREAKKNNKSLLSASTHSELPTTTTTNNTNNYQNYQNNMSSLYSYDPYACNLNSSMSGSSSLYSSTYSDIYTYGGGISPYDPSIYTSNYSYNPNQYSPYGNNMENSESNKNYEKYGYGRSRSYSTGSIYSSDYYDRKNYFGNNNQPEHPSNLTVSNQVIYSNNDNKKDEENTSNNDINIISMEKESNESKYNSEPMNYINSSYSITNNYSCTYQYNSNYSFGTETPVCQNTSEDSNPSQSQYNKYSPYNYNYNSLYANSSMSDIYNGYSDNSMDSSMMDDTNAFF